MALGPHQRHPQGGCARGDIGLAERGAQGGQRRRDPGDAGEQPIDAFGGQIGAWIGEVEVEGGADAIAPTALPTAPSPPGFERDDGSHAP